MAVYWSTQCCRIRQPTSVLRAIAFVAIRLHSRCPSTENLFENSGVIEYRPAARGQPRALPHGGSAVSNDVPAASTSAQDQVAITLPASYGRVARAAHWLTFILVAAEFTVGWLMPEIEWGTEPTGLIGIHLVLGSSLLIVVLFRLAWRLTHAAPPPLASLPSWQRWSAGATHFALYALLLVVALSGLASAAARQWPVRAFGFLPLPAIVAPDAKIGFELGDLHADVLTWVLLGAIGLHILAALYHRFIKHDAVLKRMLPSLDLDRRAARSASDPPHTD
jgi:cytochrome b561